VVHVIHYIVSARRRSSLRVFEDLVRFSNRSDSFSGEPRSVISSNDDEWKKKICLVCHKSQHCTGGVGLPRV